MHSRVPCPPPPPHTAAYIALQVRHDGPVAWCHWSSYRYSYLVAQCYKIKAQLVSDAQVRNMNLSFVFGQRRYYRKRGSASYNVREVLSVREREREREREIQRETDGSDVTIVALKLAMNSHFPLPKIRTVGDELTLSLAKNSHFSFLPSHFPSLPSLRVHHCGAEIRNEFTLSIAKIFFALFVPPLSNGTSRATSDRNPRQMIKSCPVLFCSSHRKNESN